MFGENKKSENGTYYISNIRSTIVILVILLHAALSYSRVTDSWWFIVDPSKTVIADILSGILDAILMPILFFISGYFSLPSLNKSTKKQFLKKKVKNIYFPWLTGILFLNPVLVLIINHTHGNDLYVSFCSILKYYNNFITIPNHIIQDRSHSSLYFSHYHLWYLSLLFYFFVVFSLFQNTKQKIINIKSGSMLPTLFTLVMVSSVSFTLFYYFFENNWFVLSIIQFQFSRIISYIAFFITGIHFYRSNYLADKKLLKYPFIHLLSATALSIVYLSAYEYVAKNNQIAINFIYAVCRYSLCVYFLVVCLSLGKKYFNNATTTNRILNRYSFGVYLVHLNIVLVSAYLFRYFDTIPSLLKLCLTFLCSSAVSYFLVITYTRIKTLIISRL